MKEGRRRKKAYSDNSVPSILERRSARLEFHSVDNELNDQSVSTLGNLSIGISFVVECRIGGVGRRREERVLEAVSVNEELSDGKEDFGPDFSDGTENGTGSVSKKGHDVESG